jgi:hypothetical protein
MTETRFLLRALLHGYRNSKYINLKRALKDSNPRHLVLETNVLPTELRTQMPEAEDNL